MLDHDRTQAKQAWSLYDIVAPFQETSQFLTIVKVCLPDTALQLLLTVDLC